MIVIGFVIILAAAIGMTNGFLTDEKGMSLIMFLCYLLILILGIAVFVICLFEGGVVDANVQKLRSEVAEAREEVKQMQERAVAAGLGDWQEEVVAPIQTQKVFKFKGELRNLPPAELEEGVK